MDMQVTWHANASDGTGMCGISTHREPEGTLGQGNPNTICHQVQGAHKGKEWDIPGANGLAAEDTSVGTRDGFVALR